MILHLLAQANQLIVDRERTSLLIQQLASQLQAILIKLVNYLVPPLRISIARRRQINLSILTRPDTLGDDFLGTHQRLLLLALHKALRPALLASRRLRHHLFAFMVIYLIPLRWSRLVLRRHVVYILLFAGSVVLLLYFYLSLIGLLEIYLLHLVLRVSFTHWAAIHYDILVLLIVALDLLARSIIVECLATGYGAWFGRVVVVLLDDHFIDIICVTRRHLLPVHILRALVTHPVPFRIMFDRCRVNRVLGLSR